MVYLKNLLTATCSIIFGILLTAIVFRVFLFSFIPHKTAQLIDQWEFEASYPRLEVESNSSSKNNKVILRFNPDQTGIIADNFHFNWHFNRWNGQLQIESQDPEDKRFDGCYETIVEHKESYIQLLLKSRDKKILASKPEIP